MLRGPETACAARRLFLTELPAPASEFVRLAPPPVHALAQAGHLVATGLSHAPLLNG